MSRIRRAVAATSLATISLLGLSIATPVAAAPAAQTGQYLVKPGDFLAGIAAKVGVALPDLLSANNLTVKSVILPGQTLVVPGAANPAPAAAPTPAPTLTYTVKAGDYLFGIAVFGTMSVFLLATCGRWRETGTANA